LAWYAKPALNSCRKIHCVHLYTNMFPQGARTPTTAPTTAGNLPSNSPYQVPNRDAGAGVKSWPADCNWEGNCAG
jgi:hypothetical protein